MDERSAPDQSYYPPRARLERVIAGARVILAAGALFATWLDPSMPARDETIAYTLLGAYVVYSLSVLALVWRPVQFSRGWDLLVHTFDLAAFSVFVFFTEGATSPFFIYFVFSVVCGALRWELFGATVTAIAAIGAYAGISTYDFLYDPTFEFDRFIIRVLQLIVLAGLLGYLTRYHPRNQYEILRIAYWPRHAPRDEAQVVSEIIDRARDIVPAPRILLVWRDEGDELVNVAWNDGPSVEWTREPAAAIWPAVQPSLEDMSFHARDVTNPRGLVHVWSANRGGHATGHAVSEGLRRQFRMRAVQSSRMDGEVIQGRLFWLEKRRMRTEDLVVGDVVGRLAASRLDAVHMLNRFRESSALQERVRVARDLHDSLVQRLAGSALQLAVARRLLDREPAEARMRLDDVQHQLEETELDMRSFIRRLRPVSSDVPSSDPLRVRLEAMCRRVETQWTVKVHLDGSSTIDALSSDLVEEIYLLIQEAVLNAARHGGASAIRIAVGSTTEGLSITVRDDGKGFPFEGVYDLAMLNASGRGPVTLKERVSALRGDLRLRSDRSGAEIAITLPFADALL